jgi:hypothetical protein
MDNQEHTSLPDTPSYPEVPSLDLSVSPGSPFAHCPYPAVVTRRPQRQVLGASLVSLVMKSILQAEWRRWPTGRRARRAKY